MTTPLIFVPAIGFRPWGTRTQRERAETTANGTRLLVHSAAAAPDRTDVVVEWERVGDPAECPPDSQLLVHSNMMPLERGLTAELVAGTSHVNAITMNRRAYQMSLTSIGAIDAITFPPLPSATGTAELRFREGPREWRVSFDLVPGDPNATALTSEVAREGVALRASAFAIHDDEIVVELQVESARQIRQVGAPIPTPSRFSSTSREDLRERTLEHRRVFGERSRPITLESERGGRNEEIRRLMSREPQQSGPGQPYVIRFLVVFEAPRPVPTSATLVIPFIDLMDREPFAIADLRDLPADVKLGDHRFRVISAEPTGADERQVVVEVAPSASSSWFTQPARMYGIDKTNFAWNPDPKPGDTIPYSTKVGDPPIVRFEGAVLRIDEPLRLEIPLA